MIRMIGLVATLLAANTAFAQCEFDIEVGDTLAFSVTQMDVPVD